MVEVGGRVFVSHAGADRAWAEWVAWQLADAGYAVELDYWDWGAGDNFVLKMNAALESGRMLALFSEAYFDPDRFTTQEWTAVLAAKEKLIPLRIDGASAPAMLRALLAPSLQGVAVEEARRVLLEAVAGPRRPDGEPAFPGVGGGGRLRGMGGSGPRLPGSLPRVWNLPGRNDGFTGRDGLLVHLRQELTSGSRVAVQALRGRGGVGKTQLAIEYGHRFAGEYELAWWIRSEEPALIPDQLAALAVKTGAARADTAPGEALEALAEDLRTRGRWLLVFDNADDPAALAPYLPGGSGHVLITSRNPAWQDVAIALEVDGFARTESIALLRARVPGLGEHDADRLAQELEDLPLALVQAAALLTDGLTLPQYLRLLGESVSKVLDEGRPTGYPVSLAAAIRLITGRLADTQPAALALLRACALLAPEPFPLHACTRPVADAPPDVVGLLNKPFEVRTALRALARHGLARVQDGMVQLHRLTQTIVRDQLTEAERTDAARAAEALLNAAYPGDVTDPVTWPAWPDLIPHLLTPDPSDLTTEDGRFAACEACWYLMDRGNAGTALPRLQHLHHTWTRQLGPDHQHTLWAATYLARAYGETQDHARARELDEDTLARRRRVLGVNHPDALDSASNLAVRLAELGEVRAARDLAEETLARLRRVLGEDDPRTLGAATGLAWDLAALEEWEAARALTEEVLVRRRRVLGEDHPDTLVSASGLAELLAAVQEWEAARALTEEVLVRRRRVLGEDHPNTLASASNLAIRLAALGEVEAARALGEDALERQRRVQGEDHPDTLLTASNLAIWLAALGEVEAARSLGEDTLERRRRVLGEDHPDTLLTASNLAGQLAALGEVEAARALGEDALERQRRVQGEDHPNTLNTAYNLAVDLAELGEVEAARSLGEDTLERRRRVLGEDHPDTLVSASGLAEVLAALRERDAARALGVPAAGAATVGTRQDRTSTRRGERTAPSQRGRPHEVVSRDSTAFAPSLHPSRSGAAIDKSRVFVSYTLADHSWAEWVAWELSGWGHDVRQGTEMAPLNDNYALQVEDALRHVDVVIALLSPQYLASMSWGQSDWSAVEVSTAVRHGRFAPVLVEPVDLGELPDVLRRVETPALYGLDAEAAREILQHVLRRPRHPNPEPAYPGAAVGATGRGGRLQSQLVSTLAESPLLADPLSRRLWTELINDLTLATVRFPEYPTLRTHLVGVVRQCRNVPGGLSALADALEMLDPEHSGLEEVRRLVDEIEHLQDER